MNASEKAVIENSLLSAKRNIQTVLRLLKDLEGDLKSLHPFVPLGIKMVSVFIFSGRYLCRSLSVELDKYKP